MHFELARINLHGCRLLARGNPGTEINMAKLGCVTSYRFVHFAIGNT